MRSWLSPTLRALLATLVLAIMGAGCADSAPDDSNTVAIGLLLPYTGSGSATAANFERAVLYAADRINAAGGIQGRRIRIVPRDTHSDIGRGRQAATELVAEGVAAVLGAESAEIAADLAPTLADRDVVLISPLVGAASDPTTDCGRAWYRLAPSAQALGAALAKVAAAEGAKRTAILHSATLYDRALSAALAERLRTLGGTVALELELDPAAQGYADAVAAVTAAKVDSIALALPPISAALLANELAASGASPVRLYLSPLLKTPLFVQNVAPQALEGALGVAPKVGATVDAFAAEFGERWQGDRPLEGAHFYYDAMMLLAMALQSAVIDGTGHVDAASLREAIVGAAAPPGESVQWSEIEVGLARLRAGDDMYYSGLTGPMLLDACGGRKLGVTTVWTVQGGAIAERLVGAP